ELLAVYLEEAGEVLNTIAEHLAMAHEQPQNVDVLRTIRRGYHTLKGSGRMVGLTRLSEGAWAIEQVMNRWLEEERAATPDLLTLIEAGRSFFAGAVEALKAGEASPDESTVVAMAQHVREGRPLSELDGATAAAPAPQIAATPFEAAAAEPLVSAADPVIEPATEAPGFDFSLPETPAPAPAEEGDGFSLDFTQPLDPLPADMLTPAAAP